MKNSIFLIFLPVIFLFFLLLGTTPVFSRPVTSGEIQNAVKGWIGQTNSPLGTSISSDATILEVKEICNPDTNQVIFFLVTLEPSGFVVLPGDDRLEPISLFSSANPTDFSDKNPLISILKQQFLKKIEILNRLDASNKPKITTDESGHVTILAQTNSHSLKWAQLSNYADTLKQSENNTDSRVSMLKMSSIDDIRIAPFTQTDWSQSTAGGVDVFNRFTPSNYPCGCVAASMAQLMKYHSFPDTGVGTASFTVTSDSNNLTQTLLGGNGSGGAYNWALMVNTPDASTSEAARDQLGRLVFDAGLTVNMSYTASSSLADTLNAASAFVSTFKYTNASTMYNSGSSLPADIYNAINTNLDARLPVLIALTGTSGGHAVMCDGYGYNTGSIYHHLNLNWDDGEANDVWYNLPVVDADIAFDEIIKAVYNIFKNGSGQIISGRVLDKSGNPISGAAITGSSNSIDYNATTDAKGIYALFPVPENQTYTISASYGTEVFNTISVTLNADTQSITANKWAQNFNATGSTTGPQISSASLAGDNSYIDITFSEGVYSNNNSTGAVVKADLSISFNQNSGNTTGMSITNITDTSGNALAGGETVIRVNLSLSGTPSGTETFEIKPDSATALFAGSTTAMAATQTTGLITLKGQYIPAEVVNVTSELANGQYGTGKVIRLKVTFNVAVNVSGNPRIALETGTESDGFAIYVAGSGEKYLYFDYTVESGHSTNDLAYKGTTALELNGGSIKVATGEDATIALAVTGSASSLSGSKNISIETTAPKVTSVNSTTGDNIFGPGDEVLITVNFDDTIIVSTASGVPCISLETGNTDRDAYYVSGSNSSQLVFKYTVQFNDHTEDLAYKGTGALTLNGGTIKDIAGNNADLLLAPPGNTNSLSSARSIRIDGTSATILSVTTAEPNQAYKEGENVDILIKFSEIVTITGSPLINLETGTDDGQAIYESGTGTDTLTFRFTVGSTHNSSDLSYRDTDSLSLNGGYIKDLADNSVILTLPYPGSALSLSGSSNIIIDTIKPLILDFAETSTENKLKITFSEPVYSATDTTGGIEPLDLAITFYSNNGATTSAQIISIKTEENLAPLGGETRLIVEVSYNAVPSGVETMVIKAAASSVFDSAGNAMSTASTSPSIGITGRVLFVNLNAQGKNDGSSWDNAVTDINNALNMNIGTRDVWVATGTYTPMNGPDRGKMITIPEGVALFGGFQGNEMNKADRNVSNWPTILSGDIGIENDISDNSYHVVKMLENSSINGFIIEKGMANGSLQIDKCGAGLLSSASGIVIENTILRDNNAMSRGGGAYLEEADFTIISCLFQNNVSSDYGGGLVLFNDYTGKLEKSIFLNNLAQRGGGAALLFSPVKVENCCFADNTASLNGHELLCQSYGPQLVNSTIVTHESAISPVYLISSDLKIINSIISKPVGSTAKAVNCSSSTPQAEYSLISGTGSSTAWSGSPILDLGNNIDTVPGFINELDVLGADNLPATADDGLVLLAGSACLNTALAQKAPTDDLRGTPRPADSEPDMGCYEGQAGNSVTVISLDALSSDRAYRAGEDVELTINFSDTVNVSGLPRLLLNSGVTAAADYVSGSGSNVLTFKYRVLQGESTEDLATRDTLSINTSNGIITAAAGVLNLALPVEGEVQSLSVNSNILVDTSTPALISLMLSRDNLYGEVTFSEGIFTDTAALSPITPGDLNFIFTIPAPSTAQISVASLVKTDGVTPLSGNETKIRFILSITGTITGQESLEVKSLSDAIYDRAGNPLAGMTSAGTALFSNPGAPTIMTVATASGDKSYGIGAVIPIDITFSEPVNISGQPELIMNVGTNKTRAIYLSGSGTAVVTFNYTVAPEDATLDLGYDSDSALVLDSGETIQNTLNINAALTLPLPGAAESLSGSSNIGIETVQPQIMGSAISQDNQYISLDFSENIFGPGAVPISINCFTVEFDRSSGTATAAEIIALQDASGQPISGSLNSIRAILRISGAIAGTEKITIKASNTNIIEDASGNPIILPSSTTTFYLNPGTGNSFPWINPSIPVLYGNTGSPISIDLSAYENDSEDGINSEALKWYVTPSSEITITGQGSTNDVIVASVISNTPGRYEIEFILRDSKGLEARQKTWLIWRDTSGTNITTTSGAKMNITAFPGFPVDTLFDNTWSFQGDFAAKISDQEQPSITLDLKKDYIITGITIVNDGQYGAVSALVKASDQQSGVDNKKDITALTGLDTTPDQCNVCEFSLPAFKARYLEITFDATADPVWFQLNEIKISGWEAISTSDIIPVTAISTPQGLEGRQADKLIDDTIIVDGDFSVKHQSESVEIILGIGEDEMLTGVRVANDPGKGLKSFDIYGSKTATANDYKYLGGWSSVPDNINITSEFTAWFDQAEYSNIKLVITDFHDNEFLQLNEIKLLSPSEANQTESQITPIQITSDPNTYSAYYGTHRLIDDIVKANSEYVVRRNSESSVSLVFDLGDNVNINKISHYNDGRYGALRMTMFYASAEAPLDFTSAGSYNLNAGGDTPIRDEITLTSSCLGRYIKFIYYDFNDPIWFQLNEIKFYTSSDIETLDSVAYSSISLKSTPQAWTGFEADFLKDGLREYNGDFAVKNNYSVTEILIDFEAIKKFNYIDIYNDGEYGAKSLEILTGNIEESLVQSGTFTSLSSESEISVKNRLTLTAECRYIKLRFLTFNNLTWFQLNEIEIFKINDQTASSPDFASGQNPISKSGYAKALNSDSSYFELKILDKQVLKYFIVSSKKNTKDLFVECKPDWAKNYIFKKSSSAPDILIFDNINKGFAYKTKKVLPLPKALVLYKNYSPKIDLKKIEDQLMGYDDVIFKNWFTLLILIQNNRFIINKKGDFIKTDSIYKVDKIISNAKNKTLTSHNIDYAARNLLNGLDLLEGDYIYLKKYAQEIFISGNQNLISKNLHNELKKLMLNENDLETIEKIKGVLIYLYNLNFQDQPGR